MKLSPKAQASLNKVVEQFQSGDLSSVVKMSLIPLPPDAPANKWSFSNLSLAYSQTRCIDNRGYKQWKSVGRQVRKGTHGAFILAPLTKRVTNEDTGEKESRIYGFGSASVHPYTNTDPIDEDSPSFSYEPQEPPPLAEVAERLGVNVSYAPFVGNASGSINPDGDDITLHTHEAKTFLHELGHAAHAKLKGKLTPGQNTDQETVAELAACVLAEMYDIAYSTKRSWQYISAYASNPLKAIQKAMGDVGKIIEVVMNVKEQET